MATPVGHTLAGYALARFASRPDQRELAMMALAVVMANAPDGDFIPGLLVGMPALYHQSITHSLGFGIIASAAAAAAFGLRAGAFATTFRLCLLAYASHLALDFLGSDARPPYGQPLLWPLSDAYFSGPQVLPGVRHARSGSASTLQWLGGILDPVNLGAVVVETALLLPFVYAARRRRSPTPVEARPGRETDRSAAIPRVEDIRT
jgi:hypothetical protein